jgi:hypothetical protein
VREDEEMREVKDEEQGWRMVEKDGGERWWRKMRDNRWR